MERIRRAVAVLFAGVSLAGAGHAACSLNQVAQVPIMMNGLRPMIRATMNGVDERLLLDSGAFYSTISASVAASLNVRQQGAGGSGDEDDSYAHLASRKSADAQQLGGVGGSFNAMAGYVKSLKFGNVTMSHVGFFIGGSEIGGAGVIGQDLLHGYDVEYDFAQGVVRLLRPKDCGGQGLAYWATAGYLMIPIVQTTQYAPHAVGTVTVNGVRLRALFDTGADTSVLSTQAAARVGVKPGGPGVKEAGYGGGFGSAMSKTWIGTFTSFQIGQEEIQKVHIRFQDLGDLGADMLVGADFFLSHHVLISNSQSKLYFTYNGGPVFSLAHDPDEDNTGKDVAVAAASSKTADTAPALATASDYARRGAAREVRRDMSGALADFDQAVARAPDNPDYLTERAALHRRLKHDKLALADLDQAVTLKPNDAETLALRADLHLAMHDLSAAAADTGRAAVAAPRQADLRLGLAQLYERADRFDEAVAQFDLWLAAHPVDSSRSSALNGRCWARALAGRELGLALADCNAALRLAPKSADILDSRGLVWLRQGNADRAAADYDAALALAPDSAWSLYGRGLIERKRGETAKGDADLAAALKIDGEIEGRAKRYGISA